MKKIILFLCLFLSSFCFLETSAIGNYILATSDDVVGKVGDVLDSTTLYIYICDGQGFVSDDVSFENINEGDNVTSWFTYNGKKMPDGLRAIVSSVDSNCLTVDVEGTISDGYDITGYTSADDCLIEFIVSSSYLNNCDVDLCLQVITEPINEDADFPSGSTGKYILDVDKYTVTFEMNGHGQKVEAIENVLKNSKVSKPIDPSENGYNFIGWYKDSALTEVFNFEEERIVADTTIYALWQEIIKDEPYIYVIPLTGIN